MDNTDLYIKMSDCPEVQGQREKFEDGDVLASYRQVWKQVDKDTQKASRTFDGIVLYDDGLTHIHDRNLVVWLPRQDDIQKMMLPDYGNDISSLIKYFWKWFKICPGALYPSNITETMAVLYKTMEQLWLAFYMHEKHKKLWSEEGWIKE